VADRWPATSPNRESRLQARPHGPGLAMSSRVTRRSGGSIKRSWFSVIHRRPGSSA